MAHKDEYYVKLINASIIFVYSFITILKSFLAIQMMSLLKDANTSCCVLHLASPNCVNSLSGIHADPQASLICVRDKHLVYLFGCIYLWERSVISHFVKTGIWNLTSWHDFNYDNHFKFSSKTTRPYKYNIVIVKYLSFIKAKTKI